GPTSRGWRSAHPRTSRRQSVRRRCTRPASCSAAPFATPSGPTASCTAATGRLRRWTTTGPSSPRPSPRSTTPRCSRATPGRCSGCRGPPMGMTRTVAFPQAPPGWPAVASLLARAGFPAQVRMIDGQLAFPDEQPPELWAELRVGTPQGMVTVMRQGASVALVTWGNADLAMRQAWNALAWAFAQAGGGQVQGDEGPLDADVFRRQAELPEELRVA